MSVGKHLTVGEGFSEDEFNLAEQIADSFDLQARQIIGEIPERHAGFPDPKVNLHLTISKTQKGIELKIDSQVPKGTDTRNEQGEQIQIEHLAVLDKVSLMMLGEIRGASRRRESGLGGDFKPARFRNEKTPFSYTASFPSIVEIAMALNALQPKQENKIEIPRSLLGQGK